jgi:hypothetical protein
VAGAGGAQRRSSGGEARHLIPALPALIFFAIAGADWIASCLVERGLTQKLATGLVFAIALLAFGFGTFSSPQKGCGGFGSAAEFLLNSSAADKSTFLVSSDARGEGMFIAEVAMREKRPGHIVQRASKAFASSSWSGTRYETKFESEEAVAKYLRETGVAYLIMDNSIPDHARKEHHELLMQAVAQDPEHFALIHSYAIERNGRQTENAIKLYQVR